MVGGSAGYQGEVLGLGEVHDGFEDVVGGCPDVAVVDVADSFFVGCC